MPTMNRRQFLAALAAAPALGLVACGGGSDSAAPAADGEDPYGPGFSFKHGFDRDFPPFSKLDDNGETAGFDVELCQAVCALNEWEYVAVPIDWVAKDAELNAGSCDCIWSGFTKFKDNEDAYLWSDPYCNNSQMILVNADTDIATLDDLAGKKVGVQGGTSAQTMLQDDSEEGQASLAATFASLEVYDVYNTAYNDLKAGGIDAIAIDYTIGNDLIAHDPDIKFLDEVLNEEIYAIAFRLGEDDLLAKVWDAVLKLADDGTVAELGEKYDIAESLIIG
ncbi:MAG: transporter substrate-binding domain-containing protein [Atopobiaceae bacterium]|nr:transporter substrate-binding domain-containing protein [Atopobiaceae bacterium]